MKKYLYDYIKEIDHLIKDQEKQDWVKIKANHLEKIRFFQHERLIHLLVTLSYVLFSILFFGLSLLSEIFIIIFSVLMVFIVVYIIHYFRLENGVQYLYKQYDLLDKKITKK